LWKWRPMRRNPCVYVKGRIRHADHATITLHGWHRVLMNTEGQSKQGTSARINPEQRLARRSYCAILTCSGRLMRV
jgi:hypothetical protein